MRLNATLNQRKVIRLHWGTCHYIIWRGWENYPFLKITMTLHLVLLFPRTRDENIKIIWVFLTIIMHKYLIFFYFRIIAWNIFSFIAACLEINLCICTKPTAISDLSPFRLSIKEAISSTFYLRRLWWIYSTYRMKHNCCPVSIILYLLTQGLIKNELTDDDDDDDDSDEKLPGFCSLT